MRDRMGGVVGSGYMLSSKTKVDRSAIAARGGNRGIRSNMRKGER